MNDKELSTAIHEALGWKLAEGRYSGKTPWVRGFEDDMEMLWELPDYPCDLNEIQCAVLSMPLKFQEQFACRLAERRTATQRMHHQLTARDWAIVFCQILPTQPLP